MIEQELKELIKQQYGSLREFTIRIDLPYSTVNSMLIRGINNATLCNVCRVCNALHISVDALALGKIEYVEDQDITKPTEITEVINNTKKQILTEATTLDNKSVTETTKNSIVQALDIGFEIVRRNVKD